MSGLPRLSLGHRCEFVATWCPFFKCKKKGGYDATCFSLFFAKLLGIVKCSFVS